MEKLIEDYFGRAPSLVVDMRSSESVDYVVREVIKDVESPAPDILLNNSDKFIHGEGQDKKPDDMDPHPEDS